MNTAHLLSLIRAYHGERTELNQRAATYGANIGHDTMYDLIRTHSERVARYLGTDSETWSDTDLVNLGELLTLKAHTNRLRETDHSGSEYQGEVI